MFRPDVYRGSFLELTVAFAYHHEIHQEGTWPEIPLQSTGRKHRAASRDRPDSPGLAERCVPFGKGTTPVPDTIVPLLALDQALQCPMAPW